jgi:hypothetical protein
MIVQSIPDNRFHYLANDTYQTDKAIAAQETFVAFLLQHFSLTSLVVVRLFVCLLQIL